MRLPRLQAQSRAGDVLGGEGEGDVGGADFLEAIVDDAMGQFGAVALAAEMAEIEVAQFGGHDFGDAIGGGFVGEMTVAAEDSLLEAPWAAGAFLQHFHVVIGFEYERVGGADTVDDEFGDVAEVGGETDFGSVGAQ